MDNSRPHTAALTQQYLSASGCQVLPQSPYPPDFNAFDGFLFRRLQDGVRELSFGSSNEGVSHVTRWMRSLPPLYFSYELDKLKNHGRAVIQA